MEPKGSPKQSLFVLGSGAGNRRAEKSKTSKREDCNCEAGSEDHCDIHERLGCKCKILSCKFRVAD